MNKEILEIVDWCSLLLAKNWDKEEFRTILKEKLETLLLEEQHQVHGLMYRGLKEYLEGYLEAVENDKLNPESAIEACLLRKILDHKSFKQEGRLYSDIIKDLT